MRPISRRDLLRILAGGALSAVGLGSYAAFIEPGSVGITHYQPALPHWPSGLPLRVVAMSDMHACRPWMTETRLRTLCEQANALNPDIIVLLGDYGSGPKFSRPLAEADWAAALGTLRAPLGVHAVLGNHDYWSDRAVQMAGGGTTESERALTDVGIAVHVNRAIRFDLPEGPFWLAGLGDQWAIRRGPDKIGVDDLDGTLAQVTDDAPVILLAHEPDIFPQVPERVSLTLSGHTHAGQVQFLGYAPVLPSIYGNRYRYGHIVEDSRNLIVSAGLGFSWMPLRFGARPEILAIDLGSRA